MLVRATEIVSVIVALVACAGAVISAFYTFTNRNRELDIELIKIGVSILRADPKETQTQGAREWAIDLVESHSGRRFSEAAKKELLDSKLGFETFASYGGGFDPHRWSWHSYSNPAMARAKPSALEPAATIKVARYRGR